MTSIKMNVGQDSRQSQSKNIRIPPPADVTNAAGIRTVADIPQSVAAAPKAAALTPDFIGRIISSSSSSPSGDDSQTETKPIVVQTSQWADAVSRESSLKKSPNNVLNNPSEFTDLKVPYIIFQNSLKHFTTLQLFF